ncbi:MULTISPECIES: Na+/H+ antiporter subunit E [Kosmotoga]|jgi:multicomponent Na+:H+ antiporter subunit E|uniref:Cation antiporter n=1 Tax=Kosmotoga olearia (strain ATCC BAA-1733 / DSM 21960 / TBF 19.5.1) TaxID=521045 RepID=C5CHR5_KOSOT|nr:MULTISPECIES: Na+/H+ antiporter subunit E [Kosmotoga]ACR80741.1 cation antiporter [Kosmotoga olearia TBF 19.5.1]OAA19187.1 cation:proton antiporter [Kosmotoga sp. DU53]
MARNYISVILVTFLIWLGLTASFAPGEIITGLAVSMIVAQLLGRYARFNLRVDLPIRIVKYLFMYLPLFIVEMIKANLDVARRVLNPKLPINPAIVKIPTNLKGDFSKLTLANSITLTPGTLTVDMDEENLYVHWIDAKSLDPNEAKKIISETFERKIGGIFE